MNTFGINPAQAAMDFRLYMERHPGNMDYNKSRKRYLPLSGFQPQVIKPTTLDEFVPMTSPRIPVATWPLPKRRATPQVLLAMVTAVRERHKIEVKYQSMTGETPTWRWLSPHAFATDGERWHVRAFCHTLGDFRDFVLGRILSTRHGKPGGEDPAFDQEWSTTVEVTVTPNPDLDAGKRAAIAAEYDLPPKTLKLTLELPESMLFYVKAKFAPETDPNPAAHQIVVGRQDINPKKRR
ncbi:helix-turn-helix transcriptional regulator [Paraburkholderia kirstenboschensis]|uniref:helix-turn-helix transcriptional regulator n=1 Tax=Paraburkholderia kirstenboschensis TaxID=1245436 RepID=UPI001F46D2C2|nr:WYL domain-containing protein [Paraburkholderia kirstenboschensis]